MTQKFIKFFFDGSIVLHDKWNYFTKLNNEKIKGNIKVLY